MRLALIPPLDLRWRSAVRAPELQVCRIPPQDLRWRLAGRTARAAASDVSGPQPQESVLEVEVSLSRLLLLSSSLPHLRNPDALRHVMGTASPLTGVQALSSADAPEKSLFRMATPLI